MMDGLDSCPTKKIQPALNPNTSPRETPHFLLWRTVKKGAVGLRFAPPSEDPSPPDRPSQLPLASISVTRFQEAFFSGQLKKDQDNEDVRGHHAQQQDQGQQETPVILQKNAWRVGFKQNEAKVPYTKNRWMAK